MATSYTASLSHPDRPFAHLGPSLLRFFDFGFCFDFESDRAKA